VWASPFRFWGGVGTAEEITTLRTDLRCGLHPPHAVRSTLGVMMDVCAQTTIGDCPLVAEQLSALTGMCRWGNTIPISVLTSTSNTLSRCLRRAPLGCLSSQRGIFASHLDPSADHGAVIVRFDRGHSHGSTQAITAPGISSSHVDRGRGKTLCECSTVVIWA
jgi:hypothetical protein